MENIRKVVAKEKLKAKRNYKGLTEMATDSDFNEAQKIRIEEQKVWDKFKFLSELQDALDEVDK